MNDPSLLEDFSGTVRLFPLPNLVLFPHVMQPLHIFEPRYREMTADALESDRYIAMVLPKSGWEKDYAGKPAIHAVACLGRIMAEQPLDDGRYNILLRGLARICLGDEIPSEKLYRIARAEILDDSEFDDDGWRQTLADRTPSWFAGQAEVVSQFRKLLESELSLSALCDIISFALPLDAEFKQMLLEELNVEARLTTLRDFMDAQQNLAKVIQRKFPPEFSNN